jgi:uncharacterized membrane protein
MKQLFKKIKSRVTRPDFEMLCGEIVAVVESYVAIIVIGALMIATPICVIGAIIELLLRT